MVKVARLYQDRAARNGGSPSWHGCIDHLLELITGIAFKDYPETEGTMLAARQLVGHFSSSSQAEAILLNLQRTVRPVKLIQDVSTRWWSTHSMCTRLMRLKPYLALMEAENNLNCNLTPSQWNIIADTCVILEPFMVAQKFLEGENYVTISMIPYMIHKIRQGLQELLIVDTTAQVRNLVRRMLTAFETQWGSGDPGTIGTEHLSNGPRQRPKGIPLAALMASYLDPRFKILPGLAQADKTYVIDKVTDVVVDIALQEAEPPDLDVDHEQAPRRRQQRNNNFDIFDELTDLINTQTNNNNNNDDDDEINTPEWRATAELGLYHNEPHLPIKKDDSSFNNPLDWWRIKAQQFPLISKLALRLLAIPATSAPSERVFSAAGLTIANDRSSLDPTTANELVFLHEIKPALERFNHHH